jgi:hypothetical protein
MRSAPVQPSGVATKSATLPPLRVAERPGTVAPPVFMTITVDIDIPPSATVANDGGAGVIMSVPVGFAVPDSGTVTLAPAAPTVSVAAFVPVDVGA